MFHIENQSVRDLLLSGNFGLEKESLRVLADGSFSHSPHPFENDEHIVKDFCENQTEINTGVHKSAREAVSELEFHTRRIYKTLNALSPREYLWQFSNPPHIKDENDIPIAVFNGERSSKSEYRGYLSDKYGRYKMTFSGIHVNYSFADELLKADYEFCRKDEQSADFFLSRQTTQSDSQGSLSFRDYKDRVYLDLARGLAASGWILTAATAASPVMDASYLEKDVYGRDAFTGMGSVRCGESGYWNEFAPIFDYSSIEGYAESIRRYVKKGMLRAPSELYYPVRLKPAGENNLNSLVRGGINRVELRMFDLNPLVFSCVEERDILFAQLLIVWVASSPPRPFSESDQVNAIHNFKNAAHYDLKTVRMITPDGANTSIADAAIMMINEMKSFFADVSEKAQGVLDFELEKFTDAENRYAWKIRREFGSDFARKALALAKERQELAAQNEGNQNV